MCTARQQGQRRSRRQWHANACVRRIHLHPASRRARARTDSPGRPGRQRGMHYYLPRWIGFGAAASDESERDNMRVHPLRSCTLLPHACSSTRSIRPCVAGAGLACLRQQDLQKDGTFREHVGTIIYIAPCVQCTLLTSNKCTSHMHFVKFTNFKLN